MRKRRRQGALLILGVMAAGITTHRVLERIWEENTSRPAPKDPATPGVTWGEALLWGATAGVLAGLAKTVTRGGISKLGNRVGR